ncbi:MAG TPA: RsfS/YbeB/iojap family protein, partial [Actinomycetota bacterium]|nr:RsfS/YbeB/iojap family protein [Actinomycetota bacterium]
MPGNAAGIPGSKEVALAAARAAAAKQGEDIAILDVHELIVITDFFVIASGSSDRQVRTIV